MAIPIIHAPENPEAIIQQEHEHLLQSSARSSSFAVHFIFNQYYLTEPKNIALVALVHLEKTSASISISAAIFTVSEVLQKNITALSPDGLSLELFALSQNTPWLNFSEPLILAPVFIPKPWGREIWYTGIEARGQSLVTAQGLTTPLPWVLALMPRYLLADASPDIILLKTLDPHPEPVYGDLYFELHEKKQEVYVVTQIDPVAWPNETGAIRLGFNKAARALFATDDEFKQAYVKAVDQYKKVRDKIDARFDELRESMGLSLTETVDKVTLIEWQKKLPADLHIEEKKSRETMNSFTHLHPLAVGDAIHIPCFVPHALQHGVRTLEFQTPVYERKILSFAQKVLTQSHWDTETAANSMLLDSPPQEPARIVFQSRDIQVEEIICFSDFRVERIRLAPHAEYQFLPRAVYQLMMPVLRGCELASRAGIILVAAETAILIPAALTAQSEWFITIKAQQAPLQILVATPVA